MGSPGGYAQRHHFFGEVISAEFAEREDPVLGRITPTRVITNDAANAQSRRRRKRMDTLIAPPVSHSEDVALPAADVLPLLWSSSVQRDPGGQPGRRLWTGGGFGLDRAGTAE